MTVLTVSRISLQCTEDMTIVIKHQMSDSLARNIRIVSNKKVQVAPDILLEKFSQYFFLNNGQNWHIFRHVRYASFMLLYNNLHLAKI